MLIIVFILGFAVGVFSPLLPLLCNIIIDKINGPPAPGRAGHDKGGR